MERLHAPPPWRPVSSTPISSDEASSILSTCLQNSESHPHLHPDALITPTGVTFSSHGGPLGGVIMHNLRRVAAGLRGEYLEPEKTPEPELQNWDGEEGRKRRTKDGHRKAFQTEGAANANGEGAAVTADEGWQNMSEYERDEGLVEVGEIDDRSNFVQSQPIVDGDVTGGAEGVQANSKRKADGKLDKEARKKAKKARNEERKRAKEGGKTRAQED